MESPGFSVIIPTYNRIEFLRLTLESLWQQTYTAFEVIVVDDGSTDGTTGFLRSLAGRVTYFTQLNRGPGAARNEGARHARGRYLAFLDSDDLWFPWTLETYRQAIEETAQPGFLAGRPHLFSTEAELAGAGQTKLSLRRFPDYLASGDEWRWWGASSFVIRKDVFEQAGGFTDRPIGGEDADLALRLGTAPGFVQITAPVTFAYREHKLNRTKNLGPTIEGAWLKVQTENSAAYPGGAARSRERRRILTRHLRPLTLECAKRGLLRDSWNLYKATFGWNAAEGRVRYLMGVPVLALASQVWRRT
jgi:GT2 family glycosyltransferase